MPMNLIFAGTSEFSVPALEALRHAGHKIIAVYTQPDRPAGRGRRFLPSPVKQCAEKLGIEIRQPENLAAEVKRLRTDAPDAIIVVAYGQMLPANILTIPRFGCLNVHASLLPRWRGAAPIARTIEAGDAVTGVTVMQMETGLDTGPVLAEAQIPVHEHDTAQTLHDRLARLGAETLVTTLDRLVRGEVTPCPQDNAYACYAKKLSKQEASIDWQQAARVLHRKIRAFVPWPVASTTWQGKTLRLWDVAAAKHDRSPAGPPGTIASAAAAGISVWTGDGAITITRLQTEGGKIMTAGEFLNGHQLAPGDRLGHDAHRDTGR